LKDSVEKFTKVLSKAENGAYTKGFRAIWLISKLARAEKQMKEEKEKYIKGFNESIGAKDLEITQQKKKIEELNNAVHSVKSKEGDLVAKIKHREKQIQALEAEKVELSKNRKASQGESNQDYRNLEEQIRELQHENEELKERLYSAENNVGSFLKDMVDLLDAHEISTNIGSDNNSFNNPADFEEDLDLLNRVKDKGQGSYYTKGKDSVRNISGNLKNMNNSSSNIQNKYKA
jgi:chromosome segregation ATPase